MSCKICYEPCNDEKSSELYYTNICSCKGTLANICKICLVQIIKNNLRDLYSIDCSVTADNNNIIIINIPDNIDIINIKCKDCNTSYNNLIIPIKTYYNIDKLFIIFLQLILSISELIVILSLYINIPNIQTTSWIGNWAFLIQAFIILYIGYYYKYFEETSFYTKTIFALFILNLLILPIIITSNLFITDDDKAIHNYTIIIVYSIAAVFFLSMGIPLFGVIMFIQWSAYNYNNSYTSIN